VLAVGAAIFAAGCGGDDDDEEASTGATGATGAAGAAPIPLNQWVDRADGICADASAALDQDIASEFSNGQPDEEEIAQFTDENVIPSLQRQHDQIAALPPPEGNEGDVETLLTALEQGIAALEADPTAAVTETGSDSPFAEANEFARKLGLRECGESN
jgi:hypothetical protein